MSEKISAGFVLILSPLILLSTTGIELEAIELSTSTTNIEPGVPITFTWSALVALTKIHSVPSYSKIYLRKAIKSRASRLITIPEALTLLIVLIYSSFIVNVAVPVLS